MAEQKISKRGKSGDVFVRRDISKHKMTSVEGIHDPFAVQAYDSSGMCIVYSFYTI